MHQMDSFSLFFSKYAEMERTDFLFSSLIAWKACSIWDSISFRIHLLLSIFLFVLFMSAETNFSLASISSASCIPWPIYNCLLFNTFFKSLNKNQEYSEKWSCNCRIKDNCPFDGKRLHECTVYQANAVTNNECKECFGTAEGEFKLRYNNHTMSFRHNKRVNDTELSKYLWKLKKENSD